jgi:hypothetical protein
MSFYCGCPLTAPVSCQAAFAWPGRAPHAPGAPDFPRRLRLNPAHWQAALKDQATGKFHCRAMATRARVARSSKAAPVMSSRTRLMSASILTSDAVGRAGHALTDEERGRGRAVVGSERMVGGPIGRPQMKAPGRQEYGKLSYAGAGSYTQIDALPALCTTWRKRPLSSKPRSNK